MRVSFAHLLFAVVLCISFLEGARAARRRQRCYVRLCYKCGMYINSRGKRSVLDGENELDTHEDDIDHDLEVFNQRKVNNLRWTDRNSRQMDTMLHGDLPDDFDTAYDRVPAQFEPETDGRADTTPTKSRGRHRKRSVGTHIERCIHLLKSRCCQRYMNIATYIGYRLKN